RSSEMTVIENWLRIRPPACPLPTARGRGNVHAAARGKERSGVTRVLMLRQEEGVQQRVHLQQSGAVQHQPVALDRQQPAVPQILDLLMEALEHIHAELLAEVRDRYTAELQLENEFADHPLLRRR